MKTAFLSLIARFKEPSSYAGIAAGLTALGLNVDGGFIQGGIYILAGICTVLSIVLAEKK